MIIFQYFSTKTRNLKPMSKHYLYVALTKLSFVHVILFHNDLQIL